MTREEIKRILACAIQAPSGENCQPWRFVAVHDRINIYNRPEQDQSLYNWEQRGSYIGHGAAIENICIAGREEGYNAVVSLFPDNENSNHIASIVFEKSMIAKDECFFFIPLRCTNRKPFQATPLAPGEIEKLKSSASTIRGCNFLYTQDIKHRKALGRVGAVTEKIIFNNRLLHRFFFDHISWTRKEDEQKKAGFYIDTLELPKPAVPVFKLFKSWKATRFMNIVSGFSTLVSRQNAGIYARASGFGVLTTADNSPESFVQSGRMLQRIWLQATRLNLSLHPLTGVLFFHLRLKAGQHEAFPAEQIEYIQEGYRTIKAIFGVKEHETITFMFRIGNGGAPSARSLRYNVNDVSEIQL